MRTGVLKLAAVPVPSDEPAVPLPTIVTTPHTHAGCAARPTEGQAVLGTQGTGGAAPPAHRKPGAHGSPSALTEAATQPEPGAAVHGAHAPTATAPSTDDHVPAAHFIGSPAAAGQK
jgi:hypothetical protein